jgi:hypothetical protein
MKVAYCRANEHAIESWLEDMCRSKDCPWLCYMCVQDVIALQKDIAD